jgi:hypothetical protein
VEVTVIVLFKGDGVDSEAAGQLRDSFCELGQQVGDGRLVIPGQFCGLGGLSR